MEQWMAPVRTAPLPRAALLVLQARDVGCPLGAGKAHEMVHAFQGF